MWLIKIFLKIIFSRLPIKKSTWKKIGVFRIDDVGLLSLGKDGNILFLQDSHTNYNLDSSDLYISKAIANEGPTLKRFRPRARGRAGRINKRTTHLLIELESLG